MNIMIVCIILAVSAGLVAVFYDVYCKKVDSLYFEQTERAAGAAAEMAPPDLIVHLWENIDTEEFREVRKRAVEANDEEILRQWMLEKPGMYADYYEPGEEVPEDAATDILSLYGDYRQICYALSVIMDQYRIKSIYYQFDRDGVTYNLADPTEGLLYVGSVEEPVPEFSEYGDNENIPPTVYFFNDDWLCTACRTVYYYNEDRIIAQAGADTDMNDIIDERQWFVLNSVLLVVVLTAVAIVVSMFLTRRMAIRPLRMLAEAATGFARNDDDLTKRDVIELPIDSNDEIGDLYHEIQSMQTRIVDYTDNLSRISAEKEKVRTELRTATEIQRSMIPDSFPAFPDLEEFDLYASMDPAKEVGGDFFDFFMIDDDHLGLVIADVSDKGIPAALFMMSSKILLNYRAQLGGTPSEIIDAVNRQICRSGKSQMFVTVWLGILEISSGILTCANAGHEYPFIRGADGTFRVLRDKHGLVVGGMESADYTDYEIKMEPGDAVFVYTDGVPEASNGNGEFYGMERLEKALNRLAEETPEGILRGIRMDVDSFVDGAQQFDDLTMLCMEYKGRK